MGWGKISRKLLVAACYKISKNFLTKRPSSFKQTPSANYAKRRETIVSLLELAF